MTTNMNTETGIRYGVISQHSISGDALTYDLEFDYGQPTCPKCGDIVIDYDDDEHGHFEQYNSRGCSDFACEACTLAIDSDFSYPEEPRGLYKDSDGYKIISCLDSDLMVIESPYFTYSILCSPCVPNAGNLNQTTKPQSGYKTYCLGHEWFENGKAPYVIRSVATGKIVLPETSKA